MSLAAATSKATLLTRARAHAAASAGRAARSLALVVDEAQSLSDELLEEIRLLANIETATEKLLPLVLAGQPELADRLNETGAAAVEAARRAALRDAPFDLHGDGGLHRLAYQDGRRRRVAAVHARGRHADSRALARASRARSACICDNALLNGFAAGSPAGGRAIVAKCARLRLARDFDLRAVRRRSTASPTVARPEPPTCSLSRSSPRRSTAMSRPAPTRSADDGRASPSSRNAPRRFSLFGQ